ncbi:unnamed protein product [Lymnaea stagnalis]|uniref:Uncharacterized protein n=1 Tax=Lymnaea stagnalis TaxID=6523 RepID=A0AAV2IN31_LYMST
MASSLDVDRFFKGKTEVNESWEYCPSLDTRSCEKNPGHLNFVPVHDISVRHLPETCRDPEIIETIHAIAALTVKVTVTDVSEHRPTALNTVGNRDPSTGSGGVRLPGVTGSGRVCYVSRCGDFTEDTCPCRTCKSSATPSKAWGEMLVYTARHLVFDDLEASHATFRLFFDTPDSPSVTLDGLGKWQAGEVEDDMCKVKCVTCDMEVVRNLDDRLNHFRTLYARIQDKYKATRNVHRLAVIVSHPHGCSKQVSVGRWVTKRGVRQNDSRYAYTTCTCPGCSGAFVFILGNDGRLLYNHVHSGCSDDAMTGYSGVGADYSANDKIEALETSEVIEEMPERIR